MHAVGLQPIGDRPVTPYARLFAEDTPTKPPPIPKYAPCTREEQAQHRADLLEALHDWHWQDDSRVGQRRRHLRLIRQADAA